MTDTLEDGSSRDSYVIFENQFIIPMEFQQIKVDLENPENSIV